MLYNTILKKDVLKLRKKIPKTPKRTPTVLPYDISIQSVKKPNG